MLGGGVEQRVGGQHHHGSCFLPVDSPHVGGHSIEAGIVGAAIAPLHKLVALVGLGLHGIARFSQALGLLHLQRTVHQAMFAA